MGFHVSISFSAEEMPSLMPIMCTDIYCAPEHRKSPACAELYTCTEVPANVLQLFRQICNLADLTLGNVPYLSPLPFPQIMFILQLFLF